MQGTTRNPLADSGLMGISSGATFAIALCLAFLPHRTYGQMIGFCLCWGGCHNRANLFCSLSRQTRHDPSTVSLSRNFDFDVVWLFKFLCGDSLSSSKCQALTYWSAGGTAGAKWSELLLILVFFICGILGAIALSPGVTMLSLGEDVAIGLGLNTKRVKGLGTIIVLVLTGLSVVVVGPVGFVGLIVPHMMRYFVGVDYRYIIPASALYGGVLTLIADLIGRVINPPFETPMGIIFSVIGVPFFLYLVKTQRREFQ